MAAAYSLPSCGFSRLSVVTKVRKSIRAQSFREEDNNGNPVNYQAYEGLRGKKASKNVVDENMDMLRERIEMVRMQESSRRPQKQYARGRYYQLDQYYSMGLKGGGAGLLGPRQVAELVLWSLGLPILCGTLCLCLVSLLLRLGG
uniref:3-isopropylmalate dehydratase large subunit n=1 Tax=Anthurium amnicola TaxID=1678845 RepID=A0A1D1XWT6_9ARAE